MCESIWKKIINWNIEFVIKNDNIRGHIFSIYLFTNFLTLIYQKIYISIFMLILENINYACLFLYLSLYISSRLFKISYDLTSIFLFSSIHIKSTLKPILWWKISYQFIGYHPFYFFIFQFINFYFFKNHWYELTINFLAYNLSLYSLLWFRMILWMKKWIISLYNYIIKKYVYWVPNLFLFSWFFFIF